MNWVHSTLITPAAHVELARQLASGIAGSSGTGMWLTELSADGAAPATHYISAGLIQEQFAALMGDAQTTLAYATAAGIVTTLAEIQALYDASTIRADEDPHAVIAELGLVIMRADAA